MVSAELEERMLPQEPEEAAEEEDWEDSWLGPLILLGLLVAGLIAAIVVLVTYKGHAPSPPQPSAQVIGPDGMFMSDGGNSFFNWPAINAYVDPPVSKEDKNATMAAGDFDLVFSETWGNPYAD